MKMIKSVAKCTALILRLPIVMLLIIFSPLIIATLIIQDYFLAKQANLDAENLILHERKLASPRS